MRLVRASTLAILLGASFFALACATAPPPDATATAAPLAKLEDLESFRYALNATLSTRSTADPTTTPVALGLDLGSFSGDVSVEASGAVVMPDRQQSQVRADLGLLTIDLEAITVGDETWIRPPGSGWERLGGLEQLGLGGGLGLPELSRGHAMAAEPAAIERLRTALRDRPGVLETVNGVEAVRYDMTRQELIDSLASASDGFEAGTLDDLREFNGSLWLARNTGIPVRLLADGAGAHDGAEARLHLELNLTDVNGASIDIQPPA